MRYMRGIGVSELFEFRISYYLLWRARTTQRTRVRNAENKKPGMLEWYPRRESLDTR